MVLEYRLKISALLKDCDEVRTAFNKETLLIEESINKQCSDKSFLSFMVGIVLTASIFAGVFYYMKKNSENNILYTIEKAIKGSK